MSNFIIPEDVRGVIKRAEITGNVLRIADGMLDRKLYQAVNKALDYLGGKWNKGQRGHVFDEDPTELIETLLETGVAVDQKKLYQAFYTPPALAAEMAKLARVSGQKVLEPSAGGGAISDACLKAGAAMVGNIELNPKAAAALRLKGYQVLERDFLTVEPLPDHQKLPRIVMNPPFTRNQDLRHINHALRFLAPGGILVALMMPSTERNGAQELLSRAFHSERIPAGTFAASGTSIETHLIAIEG